MERGPGVAERDGEPLERAGGPGQEEDDGEEPEGHGPLGPAQGRAQQGQQEEGGERQAEAADEGKEQQAPGPPAGGRGVAAPRDPLAPGVAQLVVVQAHEHEARGEEAEEEGEQRELERVAGQRELEQEVLAGELDDGGVLEERLAGLADEQPRGQGEVRRDERRVQLGGAAQVAHRLLVLAAVVEQQALAVEEARLQRQGRDVAAGAVVQPGGQVLHVRGRARGDRRGHGVP